MRRILGSISVAVCLVSPLAGGGCASTPTHESTGQFVDDSVVTAKVKADLGADRALSLLQIGVETYKGVVQLSGFVDTSKHADQAVAIARKVPGVLDVRNSLILKPR